MPLFRPIPLLRMEGAVVLFGSLALYHRTELGWGWFAALFFAPDISIAAYLLGARIGWPLYNLVHSYTAPVLLLVAGVANEGPTLVGLSLIWLAHISWDRMLAFGMKLDEDFWNTHLGRIRAGRRLWESFLARIRPGGAREVATPVDRGT